MNQLHRSITGRRGTPPTLLRARTARLPKMQPKMPRFTWKVPANERRHRPDALFPDYALLDQRAMHRTLAKSQKGDPLRAGALPRRFLSQRKKTTRWVAAAAPRDAGPVFPSRDHLDG